MPRITRHPAVPGFRSDVLEHVTLALSRRAKTVKYHSNTFECTQSESEGFEVMTVVIDPAAHPALNLG